MEKQFLCPELGVRELADAVNYNSKTTIVPRTQGSRAPRCCNLQWKSNFCALNSGFENSQMLSTTLYHSKAILVPWTQGLRALRWRNLQWKSISCTISRFYETVSVKSWAYGSRLLMISLIHGLRLKPWISILWDRLGQIVSLRLETLNDFVSSWPETQALNLDFIRPSRSNCELTAWDS
jgi:hypothetical protein